MIYTEEMLQLEEAIDELIYEISKSNLMKNYQTSRRNLLNSESAQAQINNFLSEKTSFEKIEAYGKYAPGWKEKRKALAAAKRQLDLTPELIQLRQNETDMQQLLDTICSQIAECVSDTIKIDSGNPFFETNKKHCGGNCHV